MLLSKLDSTRDKGVLGRAINERNTLKDGGNGENGRGSDLLMTSLNGLQQIVGSVIDTFKDVGIALRVGSPLDDYLVEVVGSLEVAEKTLATATNQSMSSRTEGPCGSVQHGPKRLWCPRERCRRAPPGWQQ